MRRAVIVIVGVFFLAAIAVVSGVFRVSLKPGFIEDDKKATAAEISRFHARLDARKFAEIYEDAHPILQNLQTREKLIESMRNTRDRTGKSEAVTYSLVKVFVGAPVQSRAVYNTTFEKGKFTEQFAFYKVGDKFRLGSYVLWPGTVQPKGVEP